jgi:hypothetical protein
VRVAVSELVRYVPSTLSCRSNFCSPNDLFFALFFNIIGLLIYSTKTCLRGKTPPRLSHLAPASEVAGSGGQTLAFYKGTWSADSKMVRQLRPELDGQDVGTHLPATRLR